MGSKHFVLVHGAQHGAWCWFKTKNLMENAGHRVTAVDSTSAGISTVNADDVQSFDHYNQPLYDVLESLGESEKIVLVGHSYGGMSVARACERYPQKIHVAVYLAALMFCSGQRMSDMQELFKVFNNDLLYNYARGARDLPTSFWMLEETAKRIYFDSCSPKDAQMGLMLLRPFPCLYDDCTTFTQGGYYTVPRVYIKTSRDKVVAPNFQDLFISQNPPKEVRTIDAGHSPFLSAPKDLHRHLLEIAASYADIVNPKATDIVTTNAETGLSSLQ